jgi:sugar lactone lactonase YvrE
MKASASYVAYERRRLVYTAEWRLNTFEEKLMQRFNCFQYMCGAALLAFGAVAWAAPAVTEITLPGTLVFPESITSTSDGTLIVGSLGHGNVMRIAPGKTTADEWIKPGTGGLNGVLGVYADEKGKTLWVCSNNLEGKGEATAVMSFDLQSGAPKGTYLLPGGMALCNDIAVGTDGTAYISDTRQNSILMLKPGAKTLEIAAQDPLLAGADGLAFGDKTTLYVNSVTAGKLVRLELGPDGKSKMIVDLKLSRPLDRPDGMRAIGKERLLLAENSGKMDIVTFEGPKMENAVIKTVKEGLESTPGVTLTRGMAWIVEGKLNYRNDPSMKGKDPGMFKMYAVPLPKR